VQLAQTAASKEAVRQAVVNPARLPAERRLEVCLQCHLQSTSHRLPYSIRRYGRSYFSFRPGEPLSDYILHFDRKTKTSQEGPFEIAHSAYRLLQSACFKASKGNLTCTTCHNPHEASHGKRSTEEYAQICRNCHGVSLPRLIAAGKHTASEACVDCHMPKRRTDDAVNVVMTDHSLARRMPAGNLLAASREVHDTGETSYKGEVALLYPRQAKPTGDTALYVDLAQVIDGSNLEAGILRLEKSISDLRPRHAEFFFELANAYVRTGRNDKALPWYEEAVLRQPGSFPVRVNYAMALSAMGRVAEAIQALEPAQARPRPDVAALNALGSAYFSAGRTQEAIAVLQRATSVDLRFRKHMSISAPLLPVRATEVQRWMHCEPPSGWRPTSRRHTITWQTC
jgi:predicted CXXCH cytochrome family protein